MNRFVQHSAFSCQQSVIRKNKFQFSVFSRWLLVCFFAGFSLVTLTQCGSSGTDSSSHKFGNVPTSWAKYLATGSISATLDVYNSSGNLESHQDLAMDLNAGTVSSPEFKLPIGNTYRFILIFNYSISPTDVIPYAYADFTWLVDEFSESVTFSENDIRYGYDSVDPSISADLAGGKIPNLDLDGDGWSNWQELHDKSNPKDPNSIPSAPTVQVTGQQDGSSNTATITIVAKDNAHLDSLRLVDPLCGVSVISDTLVNNVDGSVTRTLTLKLDLLSVRNNPRFLQALADDGVNPVQNVNADLSFNISGSGSQPYFVFTDPEENSEIEGPKVFKGIACSRNDINVSLVKFLNQEIAGFSWNGQRNDQTGDYEIQSSSVDTTVLPDGLNTLTVEVQDANKTGQGSGTFKVVNDSQIKVVSPVGRRWVFGNDSIAVTVKNLSDSNLVVIEGDSNFSLTSSTAGGAVGTLHVSNLADDTVIPLTFRAVRSDGSEVTRIVNFTVKNKPQVQVFQPKVGEVFRSWGTKFAYKILNVDPSQIFLDGVATISQGNQSCHEDSFAKGITVCTGEFPVKLTSTKTFQLSATRSPTNGETTCTNCTIQQSSQILSTQTLPNDIPEINAAFGAADDETEKPEKIQAPNDNPAKHYLLSLTNQRDSSVINYPEFASGDIVSLGELDPRTDYLATLQILSGPGGSVVSEMYKSITTGDLGLVGWWRFNRDPNGPVCSGGQSGETVCDYSGRNNHGKPSGGPAFLPSGSEFLDGGFGFDGVDDWISVEHNSSLNLGAALTLSCKITPNLPAKCTSPLTKDSPSAGPYTMDLCPDGTTSFGIYTNSSWKNVAAKINGSIGVNVRITGIYDSTTSSLFFGDVLQNSIPISGSVSNNTQPIKIGYNFYHDEYFNGSIDECLIFSRAISSSELTNIVAGD